MLLPDSQPDPFRSGQPASKPADRITTVSSTSARFEAGQIFGKRVSTRFVAGRARSTRFATGVVYRVRRRKENAIARKTSRDGGAVGHTRRGIPLRTE